MKLQVVGMGCARCKQLTANAEQAIAELGVDASVERVEDPREIMRLGVMATPAFVVDGVVKTSGKVLSAAEIRRLLSESQ